MTLAAVVVLIYFAIGFVLARRAPDAFEAGAELFFWLPLWILRSAFRALDRQTPSGRFYRWVDRSIGTVGRVVLTGRKPRP